MLWSSASRRAAPLIIGHRGAPAVALENTTTSFAAARDAGADGVELDVRRCATGELVVFHDETLARLAHRHERIDELSLAELRAVELVDGERIPTLAEAVEAAGPDALVNIEIKAERRYVQPAFVREVTRAAERLLGPRALVSSFHPGAVALARWFAPQLATGLLFHVELALWLRNAWAAPLLRPSAMHPEHVLVTPAAVRRWKRRGRLVVTWTADRPAEVARLARCGVDAIISNDPAAARAVLARTR